MNLAIDKFRPTVANDAHDYHAASTARHHALQSGDPDSFETVAADAMFTKDAGVKPDVAKVAGAEHVSPKTARFVQTVTQQPLGLKAARDEFSKLSKSERQDALEVLMKRDPKAAAKFGAGLADHANDGKLDAWDDAYAEYVFAAEGAMESLAGRGVHRLEPFIDEVTLTDGDGGRVLKERILSKVENMADDVFLYTYERGDTSEQRMSRLSKVTAKLDEYKAALGGDPEAGMLAMARRDPVAFGKAMSQIINVDERLYAEVLDKALALPPSQINNLVKTLAADRDPKLVGVKADLAHGLFEKAPNAPRGPLSPSHHRAGLTGPTQQQYAGWGVALLSDPAAAKYSADYFRDEFQRDLSWLIKTDRAQAEQWIIGLVEANAKIYAHHLTSGDLDKARDAARNIGVLIGQTEKAVRKTLNDPKEIVGVLTNIIEGTAKVVGLAFPAHKALVTAFETGMKFGKAAAKGDWSEEKILEEFAKRMFEITIAAYKDVTDPTGSKVASRNEKYGAETRDFLDDMKASYKHSGGRADIDIGVFRR
ncbi:MAG: hypothetical protein D6689_14820 [Deltaproteobacteria bacterium]|nr:MAG: hypothetical protein D6689_14820 [Deltaproteobacteria bacterium]